MTVPDAAPAGLSSPQLPTASPTVSSPSLSNQHNTPNSLASPPQQFSSRLLFGAGAASAAPTSSSAVSSGGGSGSGSGSGGSGSSSTAGQSHASSRVMAMSGFGKRAAAKESSAAASTTAFLSSGTDRASHPQPNLHLLQRPTNPAGPGATAAALARLPQRTNSAGGGTTDGAAASAAAINRAKPPGLYRRPAFDHYI